MNVQPSTPEELLAAKRQVRAVRRKIKNLRRQGKHVHVIWDVDYVLINGRSDDVFGTLKFDVKRYFEYEERLLLETPEPGPWLHLARQCGEFQHTQDVVTARSSYLLQRAQMFFVRHRLDLRWQLFVGHQSKADSYRIILESFAKNPDAHVVMVDDAPKHVQAFRDVAAQLGMADRCHAYVAHKVRDYDQAEIDDEAVKVLDPALDRIESRAIAVTRPDRRKRHVVVCPDARKVLDAVYQAVGLAAHEQGFVEMHRATLESFASDVAPDLEKNTANLYFLGELLRSPG